MRALCLTALAALSLPAAPPGWWTAFTRTPALASRFRQESDSAVFGKLAREGSLLLARGGRLSVAYDRGLAITCDGRHLVQYDPDSRTAQRMALDRALQDVPLLGLLLDPAGLDRLFKVEPQGGEAIRLVPRSKDLPELRVTGRKGLLHTVEWTDATGARQRLELLDARVPRNPAASAFQPRVPAGTRWATPNG